MTIVDCKVFWVPTFINDRDGIQEVPNAGALIKEWVRKGYEVVSVVPGTNAQTCSGLFITMRR